MSSSASQSYHILATYYEQLSETRDWDAWIAYVDGVLRARATNGSGPLRLLDAACGTGRVAVGLASLGYEVVGVDASESMLRQAKSNSARSGKELNLHHQDLRQLRLNTQFQVAISLCDSLNYITDYGEFCRAIQLIAAHLEPGGLFLFDVNTDWKLENMYGDYTYAEHHNDFSYIWENEYDRTERKIHMRLTFFVEGDDGLYRRHEEVHVQRAYTHMEVSQSLAMAGLELVSWGEVAGLKPPEPRKERLFYLARRPVARQSTGLI